MTNEDIETTITELLISIAMDGNPISRFHALTKFNALLEELERIVGSERGEAIRELRGSCDPPLSFDVISRTLGVSRQRVQQLAQIPRRDNEWKKPTTK